MEAEYVLTSYNRDWTLIMIYDLRCRIKDNCVVNSNHKHWLQYCNIIGMVEKYTFANWSAEITKTEKLEMAWRSPKDTSINQTNENKFWKIDFACYVTFNNHYSSTCKQHLGLGPFTHWLDDLPTIHRARIVLTCWNLIHSVTSIETKLQSDNIL